MIDGKASLDTVPEFDTYQDHRMAMALAPLAMYGKVIINDSSVVSKSYPDFWSDLAKLGIIHQEIEVQAQ
jgi:3-phosphoshikimate 1-carboxyvinyltransferase